MWEILCLQIFSFLILKMPARNFCVQRVSFVYLAFYNISVVFIRKGKRILFLSFSQTKCLWERVLSLAAGKGLLERKVSVPWLKQSPWQPVIKAPATFHRHFPLRRPFSILLTEYLHLWARVLCFWWHSPIQLGRCPNVRLQFQVALYSVLNC